MSKEQGERGEGQEKMSPCGSTSQGLFWIAWSSQAMTEEARCRLTT